MIFFSRKGRKIRIVRHYLKWGVNVEKIYVCRDYNWGYRFSWM